MYNFLKPLGFVSIKNQPRFTKNPITSKNGSGEGDPVFLFRLQNEG